MENARCGIRGSARMILLFVHLKNISKLHLRGCKSLILFIFLSVSRIETRVEYWGRNGDQHSQGDNSSGNHHTEKEKEGRVSFILFSISIITSPPSLSFTESPETRTLIFPICPTWLRPWPSETIFVSHFSQSRCSFIQL